MADSHLQDSNAEIIGPFQHSHLVVDGWTVPLVSAVEQDGGKVMFVVDHRFGFTISAGDFDQAARLLATGIAVALGLPCHPRGDMSQEDREQMLRHLPHPTMAPTRLVGIGSVETEPAEPPEDDPRGR
jgi:hypothetical protein